MTLDKNSLDVARIFETYIAFNGDVSRTAVACNLSREVVQWLVDDEKWTERAAEWNTIREGTTADVSIQVNRAVNFVQAHRLRSLVDKVVGELGKLDAETLVSRLSKLNKDGTSSFSARALTDLVKAAEAAHLMTQRALGDTVAERPESGDVKKGSSIALLVHQAMSAADEVGLDSVAVVTKQLHGPAKSNPPA